MLLCAIGAHANSGPAVPVVAIITLRLHNVGHDDKFV